jgi:hypothetical protein
MAAAGNGGGDRMGAEANPEYNEESRTTEIWRN